MELFPYEEVRPQQDKLMEAVQNAVKGKQLVVHAPTGLGKTVAALVPALEHAVEKNKIVLFLTARLTQHALALETVKHIREKHGVQIPVVDLIGKQHLCLQKQVSTLKGKEFAEYCRSMREDGLCEYYERLRKNEELSPETKSVLVQLGKKVVRPEEIKESCRESRLCPYEITMLLAKGASVIICDYSYVFNPRIREGFFHRIGRSLDDCVIIIDEGHNLPDRVKDLATERITDRTITRTLRELETFKQEDHRHHVKRIGEFLQQQAAQTEEEAHMEAETFLGALQHICPVEQLTVDLHHIATIVREEQRASSAGVLAEFLDAWQGPDEGYTRILSVEKSPLGERRWQLSYRCLDASVVTLPVFDDAYSVVVMSGTLTPTDMYAELLGLTGATHLALPSPFPAENRLNLIVPKTTTKYRTRSPEMYRQIAVQCAETIACVPGNVAVFFPSYAILEEVKASLDTLTERTVFAEQGGFSREERTLLLNRFRGRQDTGAILLGVMGGSFSEGVDLPGDELRGVIIVGLPLGRPDLETKALIAYYDEKFGKGWAYGYTLPAFQRTLQSAGRCIRSETDKGVIVFLDERYAWESYYACFPDEWHIRVTLKQDELIREFFDG